MTGIYKITNKLNGKSYIGKASDLELRKEQHFEALQRCEEIYYFSIINLKFDFPPILCYNKIKKKNRSIKMYKREKRWRSKYKAAELDPNYPLDLEVLRKQEEATAKLDLIYKEVDTEEVSGKGCHSHICTFKMLTNDKTRQARECKEWLKKHPIEYPNYEDDCFIWEPCDFCAMMNYVAQDDEGKIMYVSRTFPKQLKNYFEDRSNQ